MGIQAYIFLSESILPFFRRIDVFGGLPHSRPGDAFRKLLKRSELVEQRLVLTLSTGRVPAYSANRLKGEGLAYRCDISLSGRFG
jgi:hypothetical protein